MNGDFGLLKKIEEKSAVIGVIGLGYVGLPLSFECVRNGFSVLGFDIDDVKLEKLRQGESYFKHIDTELTEEAFAKGTLDVTSDFSQLNKPDILIICVPTPLNLHREPDLSFIEHNGRLISKNLRNGQLIVLESTSYPGTTESFLKDLLEDSGLSCGKDFFLAFSPEREDPGNVSYSTSTIPKVVGGFNEVSGDLAQAFYNQIISETVRVGSAAVAEATKLTENIFRSVNIALVNELKMIFDKMDIDVWDVLDAAESKPFGFMRFNPGPGWGGHCIPVDPFYLTWKAREYGMSTKFIELAGEVNITMPRWIVSQMQSELNDQGNSVKGSNVLIIGISYKKDIDDTRESPALEIMDLLEGLGAELSYHDPFFPQIPMTRVHPKRAGIKSIDLTPESVSKFDVVLIVTDHSDVDYEMLAKNAKLLLDTRGVYHRKYPQLKHNVISV